MHFKNTSWLRITAAENIPSREGRAVEIGGQNIAIFNLDGQYAAIENRCPHSGGPLCDGIVAGSAVVCPLHGWKISLETGKVLRPDEVVGDLSVPVYPVRVLDGILQLEWKKQERQQEVAA